MAQGEDRDDLLPEEAARAPFPGAAPARAAPRRPRARRVLRALLWTAGALIVLVVAIALLATPLVKRFALERLEAELAVEAELDELALAPTGAALGGLRVRDASGRPLLELARADVDVAPWQALAGRVVARVELAGLLVELPVDESGRIVWPERRGARERDEDDDDDDDAGGAADDVPDVELAVDVRDVTVRLVAPGGTTELSALTFALELHDLARPAPWTLAFDVLGPDGPGGRVELAGELTAASAGRLGAGTLQGRAEYRVDELLLTALAPALAAATGIEVRGGRVDGAGTIEIASGLALRGDGTLDLRDVALELPRAAADPSVATAPSVAPAGSDTFAGAATARGADAGASPGPGAAEPRRVRLGEASLGFDAALDASGTGSQHLRLALGEIGSVTWNGTSSDLLAGEGSVGGSLFAAANVQELLGVARSLLDLPPDVRLTGAVTVQSDVTARIAPAGLRAATMAGSLRVEDLRGRAADGRPIALGALETSLLELRGEYDGARGEAALTGLDLRAGTVTMSGSARVTGLTAADTAGAIHDAAFTLDADLDRLATDLAALLPEGRPALAGRVRATLRADTGPGGLSGGMTAAVSALRLGLPAGQLEVPRLDVEQSLVPAAGRIAWTGRAALDGLAWTPREGRALELGAVSVDHAGAVVPDGRLRVELARLDVGSPYLDGGVSGELLAPADGEGWRARGVRGAFVYVPDRVGELLAPWLPGELSGGEGERVELTLDGPLGLGATPPGTTTADGAPDAGGLAAVQALLGDAELTLSAGLGTLTLPMLTVDGELGLGLDAGRAILDGQLALNGGRVDLDALLDLRAAAPDASSRLALSFEDIGLHGGMRDVLGYVHPTFLSLGERVGGAFAGRARGRLELRFDAPLAALQVPGAATDTASAAAARLGVLSGALEADGSLDVDDLVVYATALTKQLLDALEVSDSRAIDFQPLALAIDGGRLRYAEPWVWRFGHEQTTFTGSVGLDRSLELLWSLPISERLAERHEVLEPLVGDALSVPLEGTIDAPVLRWEETLAALPRDLVERVISDPLDQILGRTAEDPLALLREADRLWDAGSQDEARAVYQRLRKEFRYSPAYLINRKRIDRRAEKPR